MTYADLQAALEQLCPVTRTLAVPRGALRYKEGNNDVAKPD